MYRIHGGKGDGASPSHADVGILRRLSTFTGALWQQLLFKMAKVLRLLPDSQEPSRELDAVRVALLSRGEPLMRLESALSVSTQERVAQMRGQLEDLEQINREVEEELNVAVENPCPLLIGQTGQPLNDLEQRLMVRIGQGVWNLEAVVFAIYEVDQELAEWALDIVGGFPERSIPEPAIHVVRKSRSVIKLLKNKIRALKAEVSRLEALSADPVAPRPRAGRRVQFATVEPLDEQASS